MQYKIIDLQGAGFREDEVYNSKKEILDDLAQLHNNDYTGVKDNGEPYKDIYEFLSTIKTDEARLDFLLDYGMWSIEEIPETKIVNMEKEKFIYGVKIDLDDTRSIDEMPDEEIIKAGEESGIVYSIEGFIDQLNHNQLDTENYWFKII